MQFAIGGADKIEAPPATTSIIQTDCFKAQPRVDRDTVLIG